METTVSKIVLNFLHDQSMELADEADRAVRNGDHEKASTLYFRAYQAERAVAERTVFEPSRSIMYLSAAALALLANLANEAKALAQQGIGPQTPSDVLKQLLEIANE
jgi:hypothetical protein